MKEVLPSFEPWYGGVMYKRIGSYIEICNNQLKKDFVPKLQVYRSFLDHANGVRTSVERVSVAIGQVSEWVSKKIIFPGGDANRELPAGSPEACKIVQSFTKYDEELHHARLLVDAGIQPFDDVLKWFRCIVKFYEDLIAEVEAEIAFWREVRSVGQKDAEYPKGCVEVKKMMGMRNVWTMAYHRGIKYVEHLKTSFFKDVDFRYRAALVVDMLRQIVNRRMEFIERNKIQLTQGSEDATPYCIPSLDLLCQDALQLDECVRHHHESVKGLRKGIWSRIEGNTAASQRILNMDRGSELSPESAGIYQGENLDGVRDELYPE